MEQISAERLVRALTSENHGDLLLGLTRELVHRDDDGIAERLVEMPDDPRQQLDVFRPAGNLGVAASEPFGRGPASASSSCWKSNPTVKVRTGWSSELRHRRDDGAGIDSATQIGAQRHLRDQPHPNAALEPLGEAFQIFLLAPADRGHRRARAANTGSG